MSYDIQISVLAAKMAAILENCICKLLSLPGIDLENIQIDSCEILSLHNFLWKILIAPLRPPCSVK